MILILLGMMVWRGSAARLEAASATLCGSAAGDTLPVGNGEDLEVTTGVCNVGAGPYHYGNVNIYNHGILKFADAQIDFWAKSILIENNGTLQAGVDSPIGTIGRGPNNTSSHVLTIHLYGPEASDPRHGVGIICKTDPHCGIPDGIWNPNGSMPVNPVTFSNGVTDFFYNYDSMPYDDGTDPVTGQKGFFGYKVLAVSYGGTLQLIGKKGSSDSTTDKTPTDSGKSWARLNGSLAPPLANQVLTLDRQVDWETGDDIAISSTDYLPGHAEQLKILSNKTITDPVTKLPVSQITLDTTNGKSVQWPHNGQQFTFPTNLPATSGPTLPNGQPMTKAETRAAVGLLSRSIVIESARTFGDNAFDPTPGNFFGGHTVARQGFLKFQIQGVEFARLGQGGKLGHYPVHFHMTRKNPPGTFVKDSSINESMTRWIVLHATSGVTLQRNVGFESIGHGFYLEDGTETDNKLYANLGIFARAAIQNAQNPRQVPGILAAPDYPLIQTANGSLQTGPNDDVVPFHSDWDHPSVFWIMNAWNDFEGNMAAGAGTCGICYWLLPGIISGGSTMMTWDSYASEQRGAARSGTTPLQEFTGNYCSSAMNSLNTVANTTACFGVQIGPNRANSSFPVVNPVNSPLAPSSNATTPDQNGFDAKNFYPQLGGGGRFPTSCPATGDCSKQPICSTENEANCVITAIDHYTSAFHWTETNFSSIWLRPQWYLYINSVLSDVLNGGITFVTGGGYTQSDVIPGHWALARKNAFIGNTQKITDNKYASNAGPFNPASGMRCAQAANGANPGNYCLSKDDGISIPMSNFGNNQRLFNIYDGPAYEDANAFLNVTKTDITDCQPNTSNPANTCFNSQWSTQGGIIGMPYDANAKMCYLPNAAIAWKQPNGFYYPPAFHSRNLFFNNVDIRHFVIEPLFKSTGRFVTDPGQAKLRYCTWNDGMFTGFTDVDRQTELNDDDGSLTGLIGTISVNEDAFFKAPVETPECLSDVGVTPERAIDPVNYPGTAKTSPYDYVTTVVFPACAADGKDCDGSIWNRDCTNPNCSGVPLYRQNLTAAENVMTPKPALFIRLMGQAKYQRSTLTSNNNSYYIDTTPSATLQNAPLRNVFEAGNTYYVFLLFAKDTTKQTYQMYVGKDPNFDVTKNVFLTRVTLPSSYHFTSNGANPWPSPVQPGAPGWTRSYDSSSGILTVTMDMKAIPNFDTMYADTQKEHCRPSSFCGWDNTSTTNKCQCASVTGGGVRPAFMDKECTAQDSAICSWAIKDVDCPAGGCFGFGVTLSPLFTTSNTPVPPPQPQCYPNDANWNLPFDAITNTSDACYYANPPAGKFCS